MHGGDIDDRASTGGLQQWMRQLDEQEHRAQVGGHDRIPFLDGRFHQRLGNLHGGIVDQYIQGWMKTPGILKDPFRGVRMRDIGLDEMSIRGKIIGTGGAVHADHPPAFVCKMERSCTPYSPANSGD
jgi:hypothetical protein